MSEETPVLFKDGRFRPVECDLPADRSESAKAEKYGWVATFGKRGKIMQISKKELRIDTGYQREESKYKARWIASNFSWASFGTIVVSDRGSGNYYVLDGGHRLFASMMRPEIGNLPCLVFEGMTRAEEARAFTYFNKRRKAPSGLEIYRAEVMAKDKDALVVQASADESGILLDPKHCRCANALKVVLRQVGEPTLRALLRLITAAWPAEHDHLRATEHVIAGLARFGVQLQEEAGLSLESPEILRLLQGREVSALTSRMHTLRAAASCGTPTRADAFRRALVELYNHGKRQGNRLSDAFLANNHATE